MFYLDHKQEKVHLVVFYRNFQLKTVSGGTIGSQPHSHRGLGVNGLHTIKVLRKQKIRCELYGVWNPGDITSNLEKLGSSITHVMIEAPWVSTKEMELILFKFPHIHFIVRSHSQIGFLQVEAGAVQLIREYMLLQDSSLNFTLAANNERFCEFIETVYKGRCLYLPNLFDIEKSDSSKPHLINSFHSKIHTPGSVLKVSSFGAIRLLKNHSTAAAAALMIARTRNSPLEFYMNVNREEHGNGVLQAIKNLFTDLSWAKLVEVPWQEWSSFKNTVSNMDLALQVSCTETFNLVIADSVSAFIPSIVSNAIEWMPKHFQADIDDAADICRVGTNALNSIKAGFECHQALEKQIKKSIETWMTYLNSSPHLC